MQVASGKINYTVCTSEEAERFARLFPTLDCTLPLSYSVRTAWLMRRNSPALRDSLIVGASDDRFYASRLHAISIASTGRYPRYDDEAPI